MNLRQGLLEKAAIEDKLTHCLIFHSGGGQERRNQGLRLAMILNCLHDENKPCGLCIACKKILSGNHPDVEIVEPLKNSLRIEQVLSWQERVHRKHFEGRYKVIIFDQADALTIPAANALLKILEEPTKRTLIILSAENAEGILPTLRSRAQMVFFPDVKEQAWLEKTCGKDTDEAAQAFRLCGGIPDLADRIMELGVSQVKEWLRQFWLAVGTKDFLKLFSLFLKDKSVERQHIQAYLQLIGIKVREGVCTGSMSPAGLLAVNEALETLRYNVSPRLVIEVLALELMDMDCNP